MSLVELFAATEELKENYSLDKSVMEEGTLIESLPNEQKKTLYIMHAFIGKRKLKDVLSGVLQDVH